MSRVLTLAERIVDDATRAGYLAALDTRRASAASLGANFWVFEHASESGRFIEFTEGGSEAAVRSATGLDAALPLWREVQGG